MHSGAPRPRILGCGHQRGAASKLHVLMAWTVLPPPSHLLRGMHAGKLLLLKHDTLQTLGFPTTGGY